MEGSRSVITIYKLEVEKLFWSLNWKYKIFIYFMFSKYIVVGMTTFPPLLRFTSKQHKLYSKHFQRFVNKIWIFFMYIVRIQVIWQLWKRKQNPYDNFEKMWPKTHQLKHWLFFAFFRSLCFEEFPTLILLIGLTL